MVRWIWVSAAAGFTAVAMGAFGAHAFKPRLSSELFAIYQTGVLYHLVHAVALWALALYGRATSRNVGLAAGAFSVGIVVFSGSLYVLALTGTRWLGAITPLGGVAFLAGWVLAARAAAR